jgi:beta-galactosidase
MTQDYYNNGKFLGYGGDWGEGNHDNAFCADGLINPDRTVQPEMEEVKKVYSPLVFTASSSDLLEGTVNVRNENYAADVNSFDLKWSLLENGDVIGSGTLEDVPSIPAPKGHDILINIPTAKLSIPYLASIPTNLRPGAEYFLNIDVCLKEATEWAPAGYVMAVEQLKLPLSSADKVSNIATHAFKVAVDDSEERVAFSGRDFSFVIDKKDGLIKNYTSNGVLLLSEGPRPNFGRANIDNGNASTNWTNLYANLPVPAISVEPAADGSVKVTVTYNATIVSATSYVDMTYTVYSNGAVNVVMALRASNAAVNRIGTDLRMPAGFENVEWLTRGPLENFNDRTTGSHVGRYKTTVTDNYFPYLRPQDTGTRQETRWMAITGDDKDMGLLVAATGSRNFEANALHYTWRNLTGVRHPAELNPIADTILSVNYGSRGTGGSSCGPDTLTQYQLSVTNNLN